MMRRNTDPLASYRFKLELSGIQAAGFSECTGLQIETKIFEYREGGRNGSTLKFPELGAVGNISLKRGLTTGAASDDLFKWQRDVSTGLFNQNDNPLMRPNDTNKDLENGVSIVLMDEAGNETKRWRLFRVLPVKWVGPELKASASEVSIESLELTCEGLMLGQIRV